MSSNEKITVALLVHTCDRYEFLYQGVEIFFRENWNFSIPTKNYFATEEKNVEVKNFINIKSGRGEWSDRLRKLLQDVKEEYVLYFQEDMWLTKPVDAVFFAELIEYATKNKLDCVKLHSSEVYKTQETGINIAGFALTKLDNEASDFLMSHQVTLWKKDFLLKQLLPNEHPWRNERKATKRLKKENALIYQIDYFAENGKPEINKNRDAAKRSEYYTVSVNGMLGENAARFIDKLLKANPNDAYGKKLKYHFDTKLTHDGKAKPRKENAFQRLKKWLRNK